MMDYEMVNCPVCNSNNTKVYYPETRDTRIYVCPVCGKEIMVLRHRVKRVKRIHKDAPRLLNLLRTELQREYKRKHPVKEQHPHRTHRNEPER